MPKGPAGKRFVHDGVAWRGAHLHADAASGAGLCMNRRSELIVQRHGPLDRALVNAQLAGLTLVGEAGNRVYSRRCHGERQFGAEHAWLARGDARRVGAHDAGLPDGVDEWRPRPPLARLGWCPRNGIGWAGGEAVTAACARSEELPLGDCARRALQQGEGEVGSMHRSAPPCAGLGGIADGAKELAAKELTAAEIRTVGHVSHGIDGLVHAVHSNHERSSIN